MIRSSVARVVPSGWPPRRGLEFLAWAIVPLGVVWLAPDYYLLASQVAAMALLALSLDLLIGYAGMLSLGHALFFGLGAYTAGILSASGWGEPLSGLLAGGVLAALAGYVTGFAVVRVRHLAQLMVTLGISLLVFETASRWRSLTGGDDGLHGMVVWPLFGRFEFGLDGGTAFVYSYTVLLICFILFTRITGSPFGLALRGLRENPGRAAAMGMPVASRMHMAYVMAAALAGIAGALLAQTAQFVSLETLGFHLSADVLVMLVLGGAGYRYGGVLGAALFVIARDMLADASPAFWQFGLGLAMVLIVLFAPGGLLGRLAMRKHVSGRGPAEDVL